MTVSTPAPDLLKPPIRPLGQRMFDILLWGGIALLLIFSFGPAEMSKLPLLFQNSENMRQFGQEFLRPDFSEWRLLVTQMWLTIQIALWGTAIAVLLAVPLGLLGARNVTPSYIQLPIRRLMDALRSIPDLVIGTIFVVAVGLGPFAGVMALALNTGGVLGKLFSEAVESIDPQPVEGIRSTGASALHEIIYGVIPQVVPLWISYTLYRFEANVRSATVVGMVGAGGIGVVLWEVIRGFQYAETCAVMLIIVVTVSAIDMVSARIRKATV